MIQIEKDCYMLSVVYESEQWGSRANVCLLSKDKDYIITGFWDVPFEFGEKEPTEKEARDWLDKYIKNLDITTKLLHKECSEAYETHRLINSKINKQQ